MKTLLRRALALVLAAVLVLSLAGCKKNEASDDPGASGAMAASSTTGTAGTQSGGSAAEPAAVQRDGVEKVSLEHVYTSEYLDPGVDLPNSSYSFLGTGGSLLLRAYYYEQLLDEEGNYSGFRSGTCLYRLSPDCTALELVKDIPDPDWNAIYGWEEGNETTSVDYSSLSTVAGAPDGSLWYVWQTVHEDWSDDYNYIYENQMELIHEAPDGTELLRMDLDSEDDYVYVRQLYPLEDGGVLVQMETELIQLDGQGNRTGGMNLDEDNGWIDSLVCTENGDVVFTMYGVEGYGLYRADLSTGQSTALEDMPMDYCQGLFPGSGGTIYLYDSNAVYGYDCATGEFSPVLNWINSDMNANRVNGMTYLENGAFLATEYTRDYDHAQLVRLTPAAEGEITEKYRLTLAAVYLDDTLRDAIIDFNKQSADYRIEYLDYSGYNTEENDYQGGFTQLNFDIISGNIPDMILMDQLPVSTYAARGMLADVGQMMDADPDFNRDDYLMNVLAAGTFQGRQVTVIPLFGVYTFVGSPDKVGTGTSWTMDELLALMDRYPEANLLSDDMVRYTLLNWFAMTALNDYIDLETGRCSFTSPSFVSFLELLGRFPEEIDWSQREALYDDPSYWENYESQYREGRTLLESYFVGSFMDDTRQLLSSFGGSFNPIGFPSDSGRSGSSIEPRMEIGIASASKLQDVCWEFIKYLLSDQFQESTSWNFPVKRSVLNQMAQDAIPSPYGQDYLDWQATAIDAGDITQEDVDNDFYARDLTQEQIDLMMNLLERVTVVERDWTEVVNIISEEADTYFAGQKTAQAAAEIIQSRVQIYISENS